jgi:hypothetical protein
MTAVELIDHLGGPAKIAAAIEASSGGSGNTPNAGAIALWRHRNKVPRTAWPELIEAFAEVTLDVLKATEVAAPSKAA